MKCKICGHKTRSLPAMREHYAKKHPNRMKRHKRTPIYPEYQQEIRHLERQVSCPHNSVLWDATGQTGICFSCGRTLKR